MSNAVIVIIGSVIAALLVLILVLAAWARYHYRGRVVPPPRPGTRRIACVGDSITYGVLLGARDRLPRRLEQLLGERYSVRNYGANGHTMQKAADYPYWKHRYFRLSNELQPDVVLIMLGTNDSKAKNWIGVERYAEDCKALVEHYRSLPSNPLVYLLTPAAAFRVRNLPTLKFGMSEDAIAQMSQWIRKWVGEFGRESSVGMIDVNLATASHPEYFKLDGIHPNKAGTDLIARTVYERLASDLKD